MSLLENALRTPLYEFHANFKPNWINFAGYAMPVSYASGTLSELATCRNNAAIFDVSHMGQFILSGENCQKVLEYLTCGDIEGMKEGAQRYTLLLNKNGGIEDDLIVAKEISSEGKESFFIVFNASRKAHDSKIVQDYIATLSGEKPQLKELKDKALIALQGPKAKDIIKEIGLDQVLELNFMEAGYFSYHGNEIRIARCGYTGEDGFEISANAATANKICNEFIEKGALPAGLAARDIARVEAGLCLYGSDIDDKTSPIEAGLIFAVSKKRRETCSFIGGKKIMQDIQNGVAKKLVGISFEGRIPVRANCKIEVNEGQENKAKEIGIVTSSASSPECGVITLAMLKKDFTSIGQELYATVRDKKIAGKVVRLPFLPHRYHKK